MKGSNERFVKFFEVEVVSILIVNLMDGMFEDLLGFIGVFGIDDDVVFECFYLEIFFFLIIYYLNKF